MPIEVTLLTATKREPPFIVMVRVRALRQLEEICWDRLWEEKIIVGWKNLTLGNMDRIVLENPLYAYNCRWTVGRTKKIPYSSKTVREVFLDYASLAFRKKSLKVIRAARQFLAHANATKPAPRGKKAA